MTLGHYRKTLAVIVCVLTTSFPVTYGSPPTEYASEANNGGGTDTAPMDGEELRALVAPIALYPDPLVAQVLAAATFPDQVAIADYWLRQHPELSGQALMQAVDKQSWNSSVKALTQFPSVLTNMAKNLNWTSSLGEAYHNQSFDVMKAIQTLRSQAKSAGNLKSGSEITVVQQTPQTIVIQPANPQVVYVPEYNPALIYGVPYVTPGYTAAAVATAGLLGFGSGIAIGALAGGGCCGWGWSSWNCDWHGGVVAYNHGAFYGNTAWHSGFYRGYGDRGAYDNRGAYNGLGRHVNYTRNWNSDRSFGSDSWSHNAGGFERANAFSGLEGHIGGFGGNGWDSRFNSTRGWGSMRAGGFGGGRFGGGHFGGGGFGGFHGGFRR